MTMKAEHHSRVGELLQQHGGLVNNAAALARDLTKVEIIVNDRRVLNYRAGDPDYYIEPLIELLKLHNNRRIEAIVDELEKLGVEIGGTDD